MATRNLTGIIWLASMSGPFEVVQCDKLPENRDNPKAIGGHLRRLPHRLLTPAAATERSPPS